MIKETDIYIVLTNPKNHIVLDYFKYYWGDRDLSNVLYYWLKVYKNANVYCLTYKNLKKVLDKYNNKML